ncbi:MAG: hypothetical protein H6673_13025 [Anaerolineales bacterium]|nr:hypothetical protein [Anaerolineales bacterium]
MNQQRPFPQQFGTAGHTYIATLQTDQLGEVVILLKNQSTREFITIPVDKLEEVIKTLQAVKKALNVPSQYSQRRARVQEQYPRAFTRWLPEDETLLREGFTAGKSIRQLSILLGRNPSAIHARLRTMGLMGELQDADDPQWNTTRDNGLIDAYSDGLSIDELASRYKTSSEEIQQRLTKLAVL